MNRYAIVDQFRKDGYALVKGLFAPDEVERVKARFMALNGEGHGFESDSATLLGDHDPLKRYPRIVHPHRFDQLALDWLLDERLRGLDDGIARPRTLRGANDVLFQTAGRARPGIAPRPAFAARSSRHLPGGLDGGGRLRRRKRLPANRAADSRPAPALHGRRRPVSEFQRASGADPPGSQPRPMPMRSGDVLFFNGQVIHGSYPNTSATRFRRSMIAHYVVGERKRWPVSIIPCLISRRGSRPAHQRNGRSLRRI